MIIWPITNITSNSPLVIKNFERIEIKCTRHDHRLTFRLNKTIAKLAEAVGDDSSLAQDVCFYRWSFGILDVNGTRTDQRDSHRLRNSWQEIGAKFEREDPDRWKRNSWRHE